MTKTTEIFLISTSFFGLQNYIHFNIGANSNNNHWQWKRPSVKDTSMMIASSILLGALTTTIIKSIK